MSKHLFGLAVTPHGIAANNRGVTEGHITTLQKILWNGEVHTTVSAESIRWAIRWYWQNKCGDGLSTNRQWDDASLRHEWTDPAFADWAGSDPPKVAIDDDVLGFMNPRAAVEEGDTGTSPKRRARLEVTRAISLTPFDGDITFNAAGPGATPAASRTGVDPVPYGAEMHATRYQYGFALTPGELKRREHAMHVVDAIVNLGGVAGNHARFLYDFSPESVIFRWTDDFAPRFLYGFELDRDGNLSLPRLLRLIDAEDILGEELVVGGSIFGTKWCEELQKAGAKAFPGVKLAAKEITELLKTCDAKKQ